MTDGGLDARGTRRTSRPEVILEMFSFGQDKHLLEQKDMDGGGKRVFNPLITSVFESGVFCVFCPITYFGFFLQFHVFSARSVREWVI
ncbi:hypothetical protein L596_018484 [Steinernema carpocapsae]|uniref:Uncharacterized protein n=1 Tax=Steinernema carpocapsae TaxID=34508 RepID=A0A4U5N546_STECR|nr:hypothetical protein L596_018484 [Steinernema carpocapsae]